MAINSPSSRQTQIMLNQLLLTVFKYLRVNCFLIALSSKLNTFFTVGQRYSFILTATKPAGNYWIRALPSKGLDGLSTGFTNGTNLAILRYAGAAAADPTTSEQTNPVLLQETQLVPLNEPQAPGLPHRGGGDVNHNFVLGYNRHTKLFTVNGASFEPPPVPILLQMLSRVKPAQHLRPVGSIYTLPRNAVVEISIPWFGEPVRQFAIYIYRTITSCHLFSTLSTYMGYVSWYPEFMKVKQTFV